MWVRILIKPLFHHIESEKYHQGELGMTRTKIDTKYTTHQFLCLLLFFFLFDKQETNKQPGSGIE